MDNGLGTDLAVKTSFLKMPVNCLPQQLPRCRHPQAKPEKFSCIRLVVAEQRSQGAKP